MKSHYNIMPVMKQDNEFYAVGYLCQLCTGVRFFDSLENAEKYIEFEKDSLRPLGIELVKDTDFFTVNTNHAGLVDMVCNDDSIIVHGTSGLTYSKALFPTEQDFLEYMYAQNRTNEL